MRACVRTCVRVGMCMCMYACVLVLENVQSEHKIL